MPRGVDNVEAMILPEATGRRGLDGDAALTLLVHEVRRCGTVVDFTHLMDLARQAEHALGRSSFAGVHVCEDADVAIEREVDGHSVRLNLSGAHRTIIRSEAE